MPDITICPSCNKETYASMAICPHCGGQISDDDKRNARGILNENEKALQDSFEEEDRKLGKYKWTTAGAIAFAILWLLVKCAVFSKSS